MDDAEGAVRLAGYAAVFDVPDRGRDVVRRGAFANVTLPVPLLWQHGADRPVGRVVRAEEDARGLRVLCEFAAGAESAAEAAALEALVQTVLVVHKVPKDQDLVDQETQVDILHPKEILVETHLE